MAIREATATKPLVGTTGAVPLLLCAFGVFGCMFGTWQVLLADLSRALTLSPGPLGVALSAGFVTTVPAVAIGGRVADGWGVRVAIVAGGALLTLVLLGVALIGHFWQLVALLLLFFAAIGCYDVAINAAAVRLEAASARRLMPFFHAAFSGGSATGALGAGILVASGVPFRLLYIAVALLIGVVLIGVWCGNLPRVAPVPEKAATAPARPWRNPALLLLGTIATLSFLSEGAMETWSSIYLRSSLDLPTLIGASGVATFHLAMTIGRVSTGAILRRVRRRTLLLSAGLAAAGGMALALATTQPPLILGGFLLVGLALSGVVPVTLSLVGDVGHDHPGQATSTVMTMAYGGLLIGPSLIGGLGEFYGLRAALGTISVGGLLIAALVGSPLARRTLDRP